MRWDKSLRFWDISPVTSPDMQSLELYDYNTPGVPRRFWRSEDLSPISDYLMSVKQGLIDDFLQGYSSLEEAAKKNDLLTAINYNVQHELAGTELSYIYNTFVSNSGERRTEPSLEGWKTIGFRFVHPRMNKEIIRPIDSKYPTANNIMEKLKGKIGLVGYSILEPGAIIGRHSDPDNREGNRIRIHVPLIIPEGDVFFECFGEIMRWDDIFAFNNQLIHSAYNYTNKPRLIFIIDIYRTAIGLEPDEPFDEKWQIHAKPFIREQLQ